MSGGPSAPVHASCVAVDGLGVLILGKPGSGKSGLALQLMALGARLVADDGVLLEARDGVVMASAPATLTGMIEARGIGILRADATGPVPLALVVDLDQEAGLRMPEPQQRVIAGVALESIPGQYIPNLAAAVLVRLRGQKAG